MTARFENGKYRDCKWCGGNGCLSCEAEADKEYSHQFPNGPQPIATFNTKELGTEGVAGLLRSLIGPEAVMAAKEGARKRAEKLIEENSIVAAMAGVDPERAKQVLSTGLASEILHENIVKAGQADADKE